MIKKMKRFKIIFLSISIGVMTSCASYLDIVPDSIADMETAFSNRANAEQYLFSCFTYLPNPTNGFNYPGLVGSDEIWWNIDRAGTGLEQEIGGKLAWGLQNTNSPLFDYFDGGDRNLFKGIRDCNTFLENINTPPDLEELERDRWIAEVKFLKAYFHYFLMHLYGPIPITRENLPVDAPPDQVRVFREPIDDVVNYIVELLDEAVKDLPLSIETTKVEDAGRITKPIALALKAKTLVWAASPLFNGNSDYVNFKDSRGIQLIPDGDPDIKKWERAAVAIKNAIDTAHLAGHKFYEHVPATPMSDITKLKYSLRGAITEKFNPEIIWPSTHDVSQLQQRSMPQVGDYVDESSLRQMTMICATLKIAEQYYTNNGIPIDEDPAWLAWIGGSLDNRYETQVARGTDHQYYIQTNETTAKLNFYREPRFYAYLAFDRGIFEGAGRSEVNSFFLKARASEANGFVNADMHIPTGYYMKKLVNTAVTAERIYSGRRYSYPIIRLTDLYLLYAEALNESSGTEVNPEVYQWINLVRARAGLKGVIESWAVASDPDKPRNKEGMRNIIKQERLIELAFEGHRLSDLRRWKDAARYLSEPVKGWNHREPTAEGYYKVTTIYDQRTYTTKEYLWPIGLSTLIVNKNLVQNPGWK
jgi:hypothetical protein